MTRPIIRKSFWRSISNISRGGNMESKTPQNEAKKGGVKKQQKTRWNKWKIASNMVYINPTISNYIKCESSHIPTS